MKNLKAAVVLFSISALIYSCDIFEKESTEPSSNAQTIVIKHGGIDWSDGTTSPNVIYENSDGETIGWCGPGTRIPGITGIWFRPISGNIYRVGNVDLASVSSVNTGNWASDVCATPLVNGDVWVAEARDGYVKFKVIDQGDINSPDWDVTVEYVYSSNTNF